MAFPSFRNFMRQFREVFEHSVDGKEVGEQLLALRQGSSTAADYALTFRTLAAQTGWDNDPLKLIFRKGITTELQSELACRDEGRMRDAPTSLCYTALCCHRENHARARANASGCDTPHIRGERAQTENLCLYCGLLGHMRISCPTRPTSRGSSLVSSNPSTLSTLEFPVIIMFDNSQFDSLALIDSGAAGNFIDVNFALLRM